MEKPATDNKCNISVKQEESKIDRLKKLNCIKQKVNKQSERITDAQKEIEQVRVILANARNKIDSMKAKNTTKWF